MTSESRFIPFPSEAVMIPTDYLAHRGGLDSNLCILNGVLGSILGALINYYLYFFWGRDSILRYGHFLGITEEEFAKFEAFFNRHGEFSTFINHLLPGIRQHISMPAGLTKMRLINLVISTTAGSGIWVSIFVFLGYFLGEDEDLIKEYLHQVLLFISLFVLIASLIYIRTRKPFIKEER